MYRPVKKITLAEKFDTEQTPYRYRSDLPRHCHQPFNEYGRDHPDVLFFLLDSFRARFPGERMEGSGIASPTMANLMLSSWCFFSHPFRKKICALQVIKLDHLPAQIGVKIPKNLVVDQTPPSCDEFVSLVFQPAEQPGLFKGRFLGSLEPNLKVIGKPQETWTWSL